MHRCRMSRRRFLKSAGTAAGVLAAGGASALRGLSRGECPPLLRSSWASEAGARVVMTSGPDAADNVRRALASLGGIGAFVARGDVVVLKPNIGWDRTPAQAANTDPGVVAAIAELCLSAGAKEVRVFDRTCNEPRRCYASSGIQRAIEEVGKRNQAGNALRVYHVEDRKFVRTQIPHARALREWDLYRDALEADRVISVPVAKHHSLATVTLGLKNMMGVMGGNRGRIHFRLPDCLADIHRRLPTHLTVIDATRVLLRNGPSGGNLEDVKAVGKIIASADVVAADAVAAERIFGLVAQDVAHIRKAGEAGIGVADPSRIRLVEG